MNQRLKAVLLSSLVFPGAGQFLLKKYVLGGLLATGALISCYVITITIIERSLLIVDKLNLGEMPIDISTISALLLKQDTMEPQHAYVNIAWIMLVSAWMISIIHSLIVKSE